MKTILSFITALHLNKQLKAKTSQNKLKFSNLSAGVKSHQNDLKCQSVLVVTDFILIKNNYTGLEEVLEGLSCHL